MNKVPVWLKASQSDSPVPSDPELLGSGRKPTPLPVAVSMMWIPPFAPSRLASDTYIRVYPGPNAILSGALKDVPSPRIESLLKTETAPVDASTLRMSLPPNSVTYRFPASSNAEPVGVLALEISVWTNVPDGL